MPDPRTALLAAAVAGAQRAGMPVEVRRLVPRPDAVMSPPSAAPVDPVAADVARLRAAWEAAPRAARAAFLASLAD